MGTLFRRGKKWGINYIDPQGIQVRKIISSYKETAQKVLSKIETQIVEGKYLDIRKNGDIRFEDFAGQYLDTYIKLESKNVGKQESLLNNLIAQFRGKYLYQMTTLDIRGYLIQRAQNVRPATVNRELSLLRSMFNRAIEWELFEKNPTVGIKKLSENNSRCRWLTDKEQAALLSHCQGATKMIVLIALKTGLRRGEIMNLKWQQSPGSNYVDFANNVIVIHEGLSKSGKSRYIPMAESLKIAFENFPRQNGSDYIFFNPETGKPVGSVKASFQVALKKAGITDFKFHDLRHTFASQLVMKGVDLYTVKELLGHSTVQMTERYAHLKPEKMREAIGKLEKRCLLLDDIGYNKGSKNCSSENDEPGRFSVGNSGNHSTVLAHSNH